MSLKMPKKKKKKSVVVVLGVEGSIIVLKEGPP
jgi:hypothetical protein